MRRLLVVMLVLGITSAANAVIIQVEAGGEVFPTPDNPATFTIVAEDTSSWLGYIIVEEGGSAVLASAGPLPVAGDLAAALPYEEAGWGAGYELTAAASPDGAIGIGEQFTVDFYCTSLSGATISLFIDPEYDVPAAQFITCIPEPITVALLGLGGLFLRRRR